MYTYYIYYIYIYTHIKYIYIKTTVNTYYSIWVCYQYCLIDSIININNLQQIFYINEVHGYTGKQMLLEGKYFLEICAGASGLRYCSGTKVANTGRWLDIKESVS